ncbi:hypothetical protein [Paraglaciecola sp. 20A4]|nr:hypothetical protein [Paraglaciecola sp. 20A4]
MPHSKSAIKIEAPTMENEVLQPLLKSRATPTKLPRWMDVNLTLMSG